MENVIEIYKTKDGVTQIEVNFENESVWLTQIQMATLFGKGRTTLTEHIQNIFKERELNEKEVCRDFRHTSQHGTSNWPYHALQSSPKESGVFRTGYRSLHSNLKK